MTPRYLVLLFSIIIFSASIFASPVIFDYAQVRSTTYPTFLPNQYASYYDVIDLRYAVYGSSITSPINVVVSPKVYGVNSFGQRIFLHNIQTHSFFLQPSHTYAHSYNPMFYFDPNYQFYEIVLNLQSIDGLFSTSTSAYVYLEDNLFFPNPPINPPQLNPTCDDFYLSGFKDIYLEEDKRDFYKLYIINSIDAPLTVTSVTTIPSFPQRLTIENINYPYTVSGYQTRSAQIDLFADTVSSNYSNSFDIRVVGNYGALVCEKDYKVNYRINNSFLPSSGNCNDIRILDRSFSINSNDNKDIEINIENKSLDYYFQIEDIRLDTQSQSIVSASLRNSIYRLFEDEKKSLKVNLKSDKTSFYKTENLTLRIDGYLKRDNREDKRCRINETISVRVSSNLSRSSNECSGISIISRDVYQKEQTKESYSINDGFYIFNSLNKKFVITGINYSDNSLYTQINSRAMNYNVFPNSSNSLNFDVVTSNYSSSNNSSKGFISIEGYFENGSVCNYSDIKSEFNILIKNKEDICSQIGFVGGNFKDGKNLVTVYNKSNVDFVVNDVISQNNQSTNVNVINKSFSLLKNSQKTIDVGVNGLGSFQLFLKGQFSDGTTCDYLKTTPGFYTYKEDYSFTSPACDFTFNFPKTKYVSLDGDFVDISFNNLTNKSGSIKISSVGSVIQDPIIYFSGYENISRRIDLLNIKNPREVEYIVQVYSCAPLFYKTNLFPYELDFSKDISVITYTTSISSIKDRFLGSLTLKNDSLQDELIEIKFSGFANDILFVVSDSALNLNSLTIGEHKNKITLNSGISKNINFGVLVPLSLENKKYNGFIDVYVSNNLILQKPFTIDREIKKEPLLISYVLEQSDFKGKVLLTFNLKNELDVYRNLQVIFEDEDSYLIEGQKNITLDPQSSAKASYTVSFNERNVLKYRFVDVDNNSVVHTGEINLLSAEKKVNFLTGFFSLSNIKGFVFYLVLVLLIFLIIYIFYYRYKSNPVVNKKKISLALKPSFDLKEKENDILNLDGDVSSKQITLRELKNLDK